MCHEILALLSVLIDISHMEDGIYSISISVDLQSNRLSTIQKIYKIVLAILVFLLCLVVLVFFLYQIGYIPPSDSDNSVQLNRTTSTTTESVTNTPPIITTAPIITTTKGIWNPIKKTKAQTTTNSFWNPV